MSISDKDIRNKARQWLAFAAEDLTLARHALSMGADCPYRLVAYHAQQCAEKSLKAFLVFHRDDFPFTHNISALLERCEPYANWTTQLDRADELTPYAIAVRYPGVYETVTAEQAREAVTIAANVYELIRSELRL